VAEINFLRQETWTNCKWRGEAIILVKMRYFCI